MIQRNMYKVYTWEKLPSSSVKNSHGMPLCFLTGWRVEPWGWGQCLLRSPSILHWLQKVPSPREISGHTPQWPRGVQRVSLGTTIFRVARKLALSTVISHIKAKVKAFLKLVELEEMCHHKEVISWNSKRVGKQERSNPLSKKLCK